VGLREFCTGHSAYKKVPAKGVFRQNLLVMDLVGQADSGNPAD